MLVATIIFLYLLIFMYPSLPAIYTLFPLTIFCSNLSTGCWDGCHVLHIKTSNKFLLGSNPWRASVFCPNLFYIIIFITRDKILSVTGDEWSTVQIDIAFKTFGNLSWPHPPSELYVNMSSTIHAGATSSIHGNNSCPYTPHIIVAEN